MKNIEVLIGFEENLRGLGLITEAGPEIGGFVWQGIASFSIVNGSIDLFFFTPLESCLIYTFVFIKIMNRRSEDQKMAQVVDVAPSPLALLDGVITYSFYFLTFSHFCLTLIFTFNNQSQTFFVNEDKNILNYTLYSSKTISILAFGFNLIIFYFFLHSH